MKAKLLKKLLNDTGYIVHQRDDKVCVGSPMCSDLISFSTKDFKLKYALDTWNEGRKALEGKTNSKGENELLFIYDKLQELIKTGEIQNIINGNDELENPLPVFTVDDGKLIRTFTDAYGWPNTTIEGELMYENTFFKTEKEAVEYGIRDCKGYLEMLEERKAEIQKQLQDKEERINHFKNCLTALEVL